MSALTYCEACGLPFTPARSDARLCSPTCRTRALRARRAAEHAEALDLLAQHSAAMAAGGDLVTLAEIARRAESLLGGS